MQKELFDIIADKYLAGKADETEKRVLFEYMDRMIAKGGHEYSADQTEDITAELYKKIQSEIQAKKVVPFRKYVIRYAAAAAILFAIATTWLLINKKEPASTIAYKGDVAAPQINKATLTLANGKQIILDSVNKGSLAAEGAANATKTGEGSLAYNKQSNIVEYHTLTNPKGSKPVTLTLPDGSVAWLNAASSITFPTAFPGSTREVSMTGEAYFEVVHNAKQPFRVKAGSQVIEDIGTSFNVNAYSDEPAVRTTLVEGSIKIDKVVLLPGQQYENGVVAKANTEQALAWKNGLFSFINADIQTVMKQLARWYNVEVRYEGNVPSIPDFSGKMGRSLTLAEAMNALQSMRVHFRIEEDSRIVIMP